MGIFVPTPMFLSTFNIGEHNDSFWSFEKETLEPPKTTATLGETHPFAHRFKKSTVLFNFIQFYSIHFMYTPEN